MRNTAVSPHARDLALLVGTPDLPEAVGDVAADDAANGFALRSVTSPACGRIRQTTFRGRGILSFSVRENDCGAKEASAEVEG